MRRKYKIIFIGIFTILLICILFIVRQRNNSFGDTVNPIPVILPSTIATESLKLGITEGELSFLRPNAKFSKHKYADWGDILYFEKIENSSDSVFITYAYEFSLKERNLLGISVGNKGNSWEEIRKKIPTFLREIINLYGTDYQIYLGGSNRKENRLPENGIWNNTDIPLLETILRWDNENYIVRAAYPSDIEKITGKNMEYEEIFHQYCVSIDALFAAETIEDIEFGKQFIIPLEGTPYESEVKREIAEAIAGATGTIQPPSEP